MRLVDRVGAREPESVTVYVPEVANTEKRGFEKSQLERARDAT